MERFPSEAQLSFERRVTHEARRFDLRPLLKLLHERGYERQDLLFQSSLGGTSSSIIESVHFERTRARPMVMITLNLGLLGDGSLLPSYFFEVIEQTREPERFYDFIRFFDHRLLENLARSLFPEENARLFRDWGLARRSFLEMMGPGSVATMHWLMQLFFPELKVHIERSPFESQSNEHAARAGGSSLDGSGILGTHNVSDGSGLRVELIAEEEVDVRGRSWAAVVRQRLIEQVLPRVEPFGLPLTVRLRVLNHASWAKVEAGGAARGYLGYDRIKGEAETGHAIVVYPDPALLRSVGTAVGMLRWLFQRRFPEFDVRAETFLTSPEATPSDEVTLLRTSYPRAASCSLVELTPRAMALDVPTPDVIQLRLQTLVLPVLAPLALPVVIRLRKSSYDRGSTLYPERPPPTTSRPGAAELPPPTTSRPGVEEPAAPTTLRPGAEEPAAPTTLRPGAEAPAGPITRRPGAEAPTGPTTLRPGAEDTSGPATLRPGADDDDAPTTLRPGRGRLSHVPLQALRRRGSSQRDGRRHPEPEPCAPEQARDRVFLA